MICGLVYREYPVDERGMPTELARTWSRGGKGKMRMFNH